MTFERRGEAVVSANSLDELKLIYRVLHQHLSEHPELMDTHFLLELQAYLHRQATAEGIDGTDHGAWDAWLGNPSPLSCASRATR